jgi:hypothetical protein
VSNEIAKIGLCSFDERSNYIGKTRLTAVWLATTRLARLIKINGPARQTGPHRDRQPCARFSSGWAGCLAESMDSTLVKTFSSSLPKKRSSLTGRMRERIAQSQIEPGSMAWSYLMRKSNWTPSIVPDIGDHNVYLVLDDLGPNGQVWREADAEVTDLETVITDLLTGQYKNPVRVIAFNAAEGWSQDVSADVAHELRHRCDLQMRDVPFFLQGYCDRYERYRDVQLPLPMRLV